MSSIVLSQDADQCFFCLRPVLKSILYVQYIIYNTVHYAYCHYIANMFLKHYFLNCCFLYFHISPVGGGDISYAALQNLIYLTLTRITLLGLWLRERDLEKDSCWVKTMHKQKEISNIKLWLSLAVRLFGWNLTPLLVFGSTEVSTSWMYSHWTTAAQRRQNSLWNEWDKLQNGLEI